MLVVGVVALVAVGAHELVAVDRVEEGLAGRRRGQLVAVLEVEGEAFIPWQARQPETASGTSSAAAGATRARPAKRSRAAVIAVCRFIVWILL